MAELNKSDSKLIDDIESYQKLCQRAATDIEDWVYSYKSQKHPQTPEDYYNDVTSHNSIGTPITVNQKQADKLVYEFYSRIQHISPLYIPELASSLMISIQNANRVLVNLKSISDYIPYLKKIRKRLNDCDTLFYVNSLLQELVANIIAQPSKKPKSLIATSVAVKNFSVSRTTLQRLIKSNELISYRDKNKPSNSEHLFDAVEVARRFNKRQAQ